MIAQIIKRFGVVEYINCFNR